MTNKPLPQTIDLDIENIEYCTTTCGSQADPTDGFGRCSG
jgi:hypothetical protein